MKWDKFKILSDKKKKDIIHQHYNNIINKKITHNIIEIY